MQQSETDAIERWSLTRAIDALRDAARQAGHPGFVWLAGLLYPTISLGFDLGWDGKLTQSLSLTALQAHLSSASPTDSSARIASENLIELVLTQLFAVPLLALVLWPFLRLVAGLARISPAQAWKESCAGRSTPPLRKVWDAGRGLTLSAFGIWALLNAIIYVSIGLLLLPATNIAGSSAFEAHEWGHILFAGMLIGPLLVVLVPYIFALSVLQQLALHSLAHNRRGLASALIHGWRIMRNDARATFRVIVVDLLIFVTIWMIWYLLKGPLEIFGRNNYLVQIVKYALIGFAGVARAAYWARAYRALGGLSPDDGVPGLSDAQALVLR